jgi:hypothetical protein
MYVAVLINFKYGFKNMFLSFSYYVSHVHQCVYINKFSLLNNVLFNILKRFIIIV